MAQANKKRKYDEITNLGAGLDDSQKHLDMREIEKQLHFMRYQGFPPSEFELDNIDNKGTSIKVFINLKAKQVLKLKMPSTKAILVTNTQKKDKLLRIKQTSSSGRA